jgi:hypothetical protein
VENAEDDLCGTMRVAVAASDRIPVPVRLHLDWH